MASVVAYHLPRDFKLGTFIIGGAMGQKLPRECSFIIGGGDGSKMGGLRKIDEIRGGGGL